MLYILKQIIPVWDADCSLVDCWLVSISSCALMHNVITTEVCQTRGTVSAMASPVTKQEIWFLLAGKIWSPVCWQAGLVLVDLWARVRENTGWVAVSYSQLWCGSEFSICFWSVCGRWETTSFNLACFRALWNSLVYYKPITEPTLIEIDACRT